MNYNDYELIYMIGEDEEAFSYMVKKYEPLFKKMAYSFAKKYEFKGIDPEDIVQQCRITLCNVLDKFDYNSDVLFYSYLLVCLKRSIGNYARSYIRKPDCYYYMENDNFESMSEFAFDYDVYENYDNYEIEMSIKEFSYSLDLLDSCVFLLRYNGFSYNDIAVLLEINRKKVDNILIKVRKKMEKYFLFSKSVV